MSLVPAHSDRPVAELNRQVQTAFDLVMTLSRRPRRLWALPQVILNTGICFHDFGNFFCAGLGTLAKLQLQSYAIDSASSSIRSMEVTVCLKLI
jgi:hypothetical protein